MGSRVSRSKGGGGRWLRLAEDAAQDFGDSEDELAVWNLMADTGGYPCACCANSSLVAGGAEMPALAGEGEEFLMAAVGAVKTGEA